MNIREALLKEHSRQQAEFIAKYVIENPENLNELIDFFLANEYLISQRAAYSVSIIGQWQPKLIFPYFEILVNNLTKKGIHDAVKRATLRIFEKNAFPENLEGIIADTCFKFMKNQLEPVAIKAFSMTILEKIVDKYPELRLELIEVIENSMDFQTAAFTGRGRKILKSLGK